MPARAVAKNRCLLVVTPADLIMLYSSYYIHGPWVDEITFCRFICVM